MQYVCVESRTKKKYSQHTFIQTQMYPAGDDENQENTNGVPKEVYGSDDELLSNVSHVRKSYPLLQPPCAMSILAMAGAKITCRR